METKFKAISKNRCNDLWIYANSIRQYKNGKTILVPDDFARAEEVYPISLCQFSNCQDCKGNDIYKGDFLKVVDGVSIPFIYGSVRFEKGVFFLSDGNDDGIKRPLYDLLENFKYKFEVVGNEWDILAQPRSDSAIANEKEFNKWVEESRADVLTEPVNGENFTVGETVIYTNGYGAKFKVKILGFCAEPQVVGNEFRTVYLDTSNPYPNYPYDAKSLTKIY